MVEGKNMFCPKCRSEYLDTVFTCADCNVPLVPFFPEESDSPRPDPTAPGPSDFVEVLTTRNLGDTAAIQTVLDGEGIDYFIIGEGTLAVLPGAESARVMVRKDQVRKAMEVLDELDLSFTIINWDLEEDSGS